MPASALAFGISFALAASVPRADGALASQANGTAAWSGTDYFARMGMVTFARSAPPKWQDVTSRHESQVRANSVHWERLVSQFRHVDADQLLQRVNQQVNRARYVEDAANWRTRDHWATPQELLEKGGDCEDYAIAKYLILREVGVSPSHMQIAVSKTHAVLIVATQRGPVVLDSSRDRIRSLDARAAKKIVFAVNELSWAVNVGRNGYQLAWS